MKKWKKRLLGSLTTLVGAAVVLALVGWMLLRSTPKWYQPMALSAEQRGQAANRAQDKLIQVHNAAAEARAVERAAARQRTTTAPAGAITVSFTADEINALLETWSVWPTVKRGYQKFMSDPYIALENGRLILAGKVAELDAVASVQFTPAIDPQGRLDVKLTSVQAGKLPFPKGLLQTYQTQAAGAVSQRMPGWRRFSTIDDTGTANGSAISAVMGQLLVDMLAGESSEAVMFIPLIKGRCMPVKVLDIKIVDHTLTLTVQPMTSDERDDLLKRIRG